MNFKREIKVQEPEEPINWKKISTIGIIILIVAIMVGYILTQIISYALKVSSNWNEVQFAYNHPQFVKTIRIQYETQQKALEQNLLKKSQFSY